MGIIEIDKYNGKKIGCTIGIIKIMDEAKYIDNIRRFWVNQNIDKYYQ